ncbi:MAG: response regulator [Treponema sp.]|nr:response regulator [Treponema sp.]
MKNVLIIDAPVMLREFLTEKLSAEKVAVESADSQRDAVARMFSILPDLIILNVEKSVEDVYEFLSKKKNDVNGKKIPIIMCGPVLGKEEVADLAQYGVIKYFAKPIKFDIFFESIGRVLRMPFAVDDTPCILDIHLSKNIIFIEIALGLNHEKIAMLKYRLSDIIEKNHLAMPTVILMLTSLSLSFVDGYNLEYLFETVTSDNRILKKNIKVLSLDSITKEFIEGHTELNGIEVVENLSSVLNSLVEGNVTTDAQDVIADTLLVPEKDVSSSTIEMRFSAESESEKEKKKMSAKIAVVDSDPAVCQSLLNVLQSISNEISVFQNGTQFVQSLSQKNYDIAIMEIYLPGINGFQILKTLLDKNISLDVIVYSQITQKEYIMQTLRLGAKSYILKPQKPEVVFQKVVEILNAK